MAKEIQREELGIFFFQGFLEGGKTSYIQKLIEDEGLPEQVRILIIQTEEGLEELQPVPGRAVYVAQFERLEDITPEKLTELEDESQCNTVMVELNGMWEEMDFFERMPEHWYPFRKFVIADASTFLSYNNNMRTLTYDKLREATVVVFNRVTEATDRLTLHRIVRAASRGVPIYFELPDGTEEYDDLPDELPWDMDADIVEIEDRDFAEWERDISEEPEKYEGKILRLRGFAVQSQDRRPGRFAFGRQVMTCCEADITFLGFPAVIAPANMPVMGSWVELTAQVHLEVRGEGLETQLMAITCDRLDRPEDTLATFY